MKKQNKKHPGLKQKLTAFDKISYVFDEIIEQAKEHGRNIPIKAVIKEFSKDKKDNVLIISEKEVLKIISKLEQNGAVFYSRKGCIERLNHG